ncbi:EboA domain-containing protein [Pedobacter gandavensis]|uniref:EboA domain-containing protein n=1 Tax=Pedobacter gandavensis TaxID=2679963 RepID=UPI0024790B32|nr:EboA domain-containing protein [Pedobacter gandavensis]WGQ11331.1 EboA domain-containing protein [Pedobacter gandavensis]
MYEPAAMNTQLLLAEFLREQLSDAELNWLHTNVKSLEENELLRRFIPLFSSVPRFIARRKAVFSTAVLALFEARYPGFSNSEWDLQELCRISLMLELPVSKNEAALKELFETAAINELRVLYKGLYFLENAADFTGRLAEGVRTNMTDVFDAIIVQNPFAAKYLAEDAWNQLVMKAVFTGRPLFSIYGLDQRANEKLAKILQGYIRERCSAGRTVSPEVWRVIYPFVTDEVATELKRILN